MGQTISAAQAIDRGQFEAGGDPRPMEGGSVQGQELTDLGERAEVVRRLDGDGRFNAVVRDGERYFLARLETDS